MKFLSRKVKIFRHRASRKRYAYKRLSQSWKSRKKSKRQNQQSSNIKKKRRQKKLPLNLPAPENFSLISNTNNVLGYFSDAEKQLKNGNNVTLNISEVKNLTADTLALMVASINNPEFLSEGVVHGDAPKDKKAFELFTQSGFYNHVKSATGFKKSSNNLLHREFKKGVQDGIAGDAYDATIKHVFGTRLAFDPLYNLLIECMSNTNDHADLDVPGRCHWWLYVYNYPNEHRTSYSFLDLGVGIFKSTIVQSYLKNKLKGTPLYKHINLVDDLLNGKIKTRIISEDSKIRGKGIPEMVEYSKLSEFGCFYIIANDVKIDLKSGEREQLNYSLDGTFLYWEIQNI